jgi:hypothetical protein
MKAVSRTTCVLEPGAETRSHVRGSVMVRIFLVTMRHAGSGLRSRLPVCGMSLLQERRGDGGEVPSVEMTVDADVGASLGDGVEERSESTNISGEMAGALSSTGSVGCAMNLDNGIRRLLRVGLGRGGAALRDNRPCASPWIIIGDEGTV